MTLAKSDSRDLYKDFFTNLVADYPIVIISFSLKVMLLTDHLSFGDLEKTFLYLNQMFIRHYIIDKFATSFDD